VWSLSFPPLHQLAFILFELVSINTILSEQLLYQDSLASSPAQDSPASSRLVHSRHSGFPFPAFSERGGQGEIIGVEGEKSHVSVPLEVIGPAFYHLPQIFFCMCRPSASQAASDRRASAASHAKLRSLPVEQARLESERSPM
jgi:hypothetical protein